jgi:Subtilase family
LLTRVRAAAFCGVATVAVLAGWAASPSASAASTSRPGLPSPASGQLVRELLSAWQITKGEGVTVAVLSTRVAPVSGLSGKLVQGPDYAPLAGASATDGTALAAMIAANGPSAQNPFGTIGLAPGARILAVPIVDWGARGNGKYTTDQTWQSIEAKAIRYAAAHGAQVIVCDEQGYDGTPALDSAVAYAVSKNAVVLGGDGVFGSTPNGPQYPNSLPGVINFSGSTLRGLPGLPSKVISPVNNSILVTAPSNPMATTGPGNQPYTYWGGYVSTAWVAATVAMIKSVYPDIPPSMVARALAMSASYHPAGGYNTTVGFGLVNPVGALHDAGALMKLRDTATPGQGTVSTTARFGGGAAPGTIDAVHHAPAKLAGFAAAAVIGAALLLLALILSRRWRRKAAVVPAAPPLLPAPASAVPVTAVPVTAVPVAAVPVATEPVPAEPGPAEPPTAQPGGMPTP